MANIIINNLSFPFNEGCRLLKLKYDECPKQFEKTLGDFWNEIEPMNFKEIATTFNNIEQRRIAIDCLGLERLSQQINPTLISSETMNKTTTWVTQSGELKTFDFNDTYELYEVSGEVWGEGLNSNFVLPTHYVKFKDTSTDRTYMIWVDASSVYRTNVNTWTSSRENYGSKITPIQAIAWTIQTDVPIGGIEKMVRQGDCVLIKKKDNIKKGQVRHITENEYRELLVFES